MLRFDQSLHCRLRFAESMQSNRTIHSWIPNHCTDREGSNVKFLIQLGKIPRSTTVTRYETGSLLWYILLQFQECKLRIPDSKGDNLIDLRVDGQITLKWVLKKG
jgi:hypothetical protein